VFTESKLDSGPGLLDEIQQPAVNRAGGSGSARRRPGETLSSRRRWPVMQMMLLGLRRRPATHHAVHAAQRKRRRSQRRPLFPSDPVKQRTHTLSPREHTTKLAPRHTRCHSVVLYWVKGFSVCSTTHYTTKLCCFISTP
jgi:hypothetical protein